MWFGSLILSLIAGLCSIHCKMWLDGYGVYLSTFFMLNGSFVLIMWQVDLVFTGAAGDLVNACRLRQYVRHTLL
jgi:hypothetical protein